MKKSEVTRPLGVLGVGELEERTYTVLLDHRNATLSELSEALGLSRGRMQRAVDALEEIGLVTHIPEKPRRYVPGPPAIALQALVVRYGEEIKRAQAEIARFQNHFDAAKGPDKTEEVLEIITSPEAQLQVFKQIYDVAQHEVLSLIRPPERIPREEAPECYEAQMRARRRGVRCLSVVDAAELELPGNLPNVRGDMEAGEDTRFYPKLPFKMILVDHKIAIIPLKLEEPTSPMVVMRTSALLDAMQAMFDLIWAQSVPIAFKQGGNVEFGEQDMAVPDETSELIILLAAGLSDKVIAHELDISMRTVQRHVAELMKGLNVRTRFQAGWMAALRRSPESEQR